MGLHLFSPESLFLGFLIFCRVSAVFLVFPIFNQAVIPILVRILVAVSFSIFIYFSGNAQGWFPLNVFQVYAADIFSLFFFILKEIGFGLLLGFLARSFFDAIEMGGNLAGTFMGLSTATIVDPSQKTQSQVVGQIQKTLALLMFLAMQGHYLLLKALLKSYQLVHIGSFQWKGKIFDFVLHFSLELFYIALQIAAPIGISILILNIIYGVLAKAIPQLNVFVLSFSVSILVGIFVFWLSLPFFQSLMGDLVLKMGERMWLFLKLVS